MLLAEKYVAADLNAALHFAAKEAKAEGEAKGEAKGRAEEKKAIGEQAAELRRNGKTSDEILSILFPEQPTLN